MKTKEEILRRIKSANSWRETGVTLYDAYTAFSSNSSGSSNEDVKVLEAKIKRLENANKQLRDENKRLKGKS